MVRICREFLVSANPIILSLEEKGLSEAEVKSWFEENNSDYSVSVALYYIAQKKVFLKPMVVPLDELNLDDYEPGSLLSGDRGGDLSLSW